LRDAIKEKNQIERINQTEEADGEEYQSNKEESNQIVST
jgi:hypothetical protein